MLKIVEDIIQGLDCGYIFEYEENSMMNVKVDSYKRGDSFVYVEEFRSGRIVPGRYGGMRKEMKLQVYFCKFCEFHNDAIKREVVRETILSEVVYPFINAYERAGYKIVSDWGLYYPLARFDANEVSVMLEFIPSVDLCVK